MPVISTNIAANSAVRYLNINSAEQTSSLSKLASGSRITQASDDAAGLAISTRISSDVTALTQAATNASHGISVLQTADGGASNITDILQRMKSLASESASGTVTDSERVYIDAEFSQLVDEVDGISTSTRYNGESLLDGTSDFSGSGVSVVVGSDASDTIQVSIGTLTAAGLGLVATADVPAVAAVPAKAAVPATAATLTGDASTKITVADGVDASFDINGKTITLASATGSATDYTMGEVADAINNETATTGVTATVNAAGALELKTSATGAAATITVDGISGTTASALGFGTTATATGTAAAAAVPATAAVDAVTAGDPISVATQAGATSALAAIDSATDLVSQARANIGALESRFSFRSDAISTTIENLSAANSAIMDTDVASESANLAAAKVKTQAAVAAAAQASQMPQDLLKLMQ